jgi:NAD(P)-dependent dehydrogenase (short-subunit alcohol dehydrogenase family)
MNHIQVRGTYAVTKAHIPQMIGRENPHILTLSPLIRLGAKWLKPTACMMAKYGMTLCALGIAEELRDHGLASNTLWPRTLVATAAVQNLVGGDEAMSRARKPTVYADAAYHVLNQPARQYTGNTPLARTFWSALASMTFPCTTVFWAPHSKSICGPILPIRRASITAVHFPTPKWKLDHNIE